MSLIVNTGRIDITIDVSTASEEVNVDYDTTFTVVNPGPVMTQTGSIISLTISA